jgi:ankyrin repeat protein
MAENLLFYAAKQGDKEQLLHILQDDIFGVNTQNEEGETSLHLAVTGEHVEFVAALLQAGADPNISSKSGSTPLLYAARSSASSMVELLVDHGALVNMQSAVGGWIALHEACRYGRRQTVKLLLSRGSVVEVSDHADSRLANCDWQPIHFAVCGGHVACVDELINAGASVNIPGGPEGNTPLLEALNYGYGQYECASVLLQNGADAQQKNHVGIFPLLKAVGQPDQPVEFTKLLIDHGADVNQLMVTAPSRSVGFNKQHITPIAMWAVRGTSPEVLRVLLEHGADLSLSDNMNLNLALFELLNRKNESLLVDFINICHSYHCLDLKKRSVQWQRTIVAELIFNACNWRKDHNYLRNALIIILAAGASVTDASGISGIPPIKSVIKRKWKDTINVMVEGHIWVEGELPDILTESELSIGQGMWFSSHLLSQGLLFGLSSSVDKPSGLLSVCH